jgi:hypothetical protein
MAHPPPYPGADDATDGDAGERPEQAPASGAPRRVSVLLIVVAIIVFLLIVVSHLAGVVGPGAH